MKPTQNDLSENVRKSIIDLCNSHLADALHLKMQLKQAHWNVTGPNFIALHELFDQVADEADNWGDLIAERATSLGGPADGTLAAVKEASTLEEYSRTERDAKAHVKAVSKALSTFGARARKAIETASDAGDEVTADVFTEVARGVDKQLWFVESHNS